MPLIWRISYSPLILGLAYQVMIPQSVVSPNAVSIQTPACSVNNNRWDKVFFLYNSPQTELCAEPPVLLVLLPWLSFLGSASSAGSASIRASQHHAALTGICHRAAHTPSPGEHIRVSLGLFGPIFGFSFFFFSLPLKHGLLWTE